MLLLIDNFDSFTYNLVQAFQMLGTQVIVRRNHLSYFDDCVSLNPRHLVIGPGPGHPSQAFLSKQLIQTFAGRCPILGICLGHQALAELYGGSIERASYPMHGKTSVIHHTNQGIFKGIPQKFLATRYHSLIVNAKSICFPLEITALTDDQQVMGLRHQSLSLESVQFHPEAILTEYGLHLLKNFLTSEC